MKGIILAGGSGTRLQPLTNIVCKQLLPVYDKPMIHYPLSTLMMLGLTEIMIISTPVDTPKFQAVLGDGSQLGIKLEYAIQEKPAGLAEAFIIAEDFIGGEPVCLILGDNILYWGNLTSIWEQCIKLQEGAYIVGIHTNEPHRFGVIEMDAQGKVLSLEEKPKEPKSNIAAIGLYFYDKHVVEYAKQVKPSARGELEITDLNNIYLEKGKLKAKYLSRGTTWLDAGTIDTLTEASNFIRIIENLHNLKIGCIEEVAYNMEYINQKQLLTLADQYNKSPYGEYLKRVAGTQKVKA